MWNAVCDFFSSQPTVTVIHRHHESNTDAKHCDISTVKTAGDALALPQDEMPRAGVRAAAIQRSGRDKGSLRAWSVEKDS